MKNVVLLVGIMSVMAVPQAENGSIDGKWNIQRSVAGNDSEVECTFIQKKDALDGSCESDDPGKPAALMGKLDGKKITWSVQGNYNGTTTTITYKGVIDAGVIKGTLKVDPFGVDGEFSATPIKPKQ